MRKLRLLCLFCVFGVLVFCGNAFAADPAILASLQTKHAVVQVDNATLADAKGANYQIRWKRFQFRDDFWNNSRSYNPAWWTSAGYNLIISNVSGHMQADYNTKYILGNYTTSTGSGFGPYGSQWGTQWASHW